jgi:AcrR family transcriptional regulator
MARVVKKHAVRRNEILDEAQRLVYTRGYEQVTIQDILDDLQIAKGTFYHYFHSKQALLEAMIERMIEAVEQRLGPVVHDPHLPALEKLQCFFDTIGRWKTEQKTLLMALLRAWYTDDNAIARQKVRVAALARIVPLLTAIIRQGEEEGVLMTRYPDQVGEVAMSLGQGLDEALAAQLLAAEPGPDHLRRMELTAAAYTDAIERVLGAPPNSLHFVDAEMLKAWAIVPADGA